MNSTIDGGGWDAVSAVATMLSAVAVSVSLIIILFQLRRMKHSQEVGVMLSLYDRSTSDSMMQASRWVKSEMPVGFSYDDFRCNGEYRSKIEELWYYFEFLGVMVDKNHVRESIIFDQQGTFIEGMWSKTSHLIEARRVDRRSPQYMENFQLLVERYRRWAERTKPKMGPKSRRAKEYYYDGDRLVMTGLRERRHNGSGS